MRICGIYKITSPSKKVYIGQSIDIASRWNSHRNSNSKTKLNSSFKKHGVDKHRFEIICQCSPKELNNLEIYYMDLYQCFNTEYGLNLHSGGNKHIISDETRKKMSLSHFGKPTWNKGLTKETDDRIKKMGEIQRKKRIGKAMSQETKQKIRESHIGLNTWQKDRKHTEETKRKMSVVHKGKNTWTKGTKRSEEVKKQISETLKKRYKKL